MATIKELIAGDSASFSDRFASYSPVDGWSLVYVFIHANNEYRATLDATTVDDGFSVEMSSSASSQMVPGVYSCSALLSRDDERKTFVLPDLTVLPDPESPSYDPRTYPERMLAAIEAVLEKRASRIESEYSTASGKQLKLLTPEELITLRNKFKREVSMQKNKSKGLTGRIVPRFK